MMTLTSITSIRDTLKPLRANKTIASVPTMGNLHDGHLKLVELAQKYADIVVVSIFVNPTQFAEGEDLDSYPRTLEKDIQKLNNIGVDYVFAPTVADMYPVMPPPTQVLAGDISQKLCGKSRPTHFNGVGIVVTKLFNIIKPNMAVFGKKDYQQLAIIRQLVRDLSYDIHIIGAPIVRSEDGLALSSRNQYLTKNEREIAPQLHQQLLLLADKLLQQPPRSVTNLQKLIGDSIANINSIGFRVDYLEVRNQDLTAITEQQLRGTQSNHWVIAVAAQLGKARLLDNQEVDIVNKP